MAAIIGTQTDNVLIDTVDDDAILALGGADMITVSQGRDVVDGGAGADRLIVSYGMATAGVRNSGETGFDNAAGNATTAVTFDDIERFSVTTGSGDDSIRTFVRDDVSDTNNRTVISGNDFISAGAGNDSIAGGDGNDELHGGEGNDVVDGDGSLRGKFGGLLTDIEFIGDDMLFGDAGDDDIYGGNGSDILNGGIGDDEIYGDRSAFRAIDSSAFGGPGVQIQMNIGNDMLSGNDMLDGGDGNDTLVGNAGNDTILGGEGNDTARVTVTSDGADQVNLGNGNDVVAVSANAGSEVSSRIRLTFTSAEIGNGNANDSNTMTGQDGGLAVRLQSENYADGLVGPVSRYDDEGITFVASNESAPQVTFDVRDLVSGVARGDAFEVVVLGTSGNDVQTALQASRPYYFNAGMGNDSVTGGSANDFLVGNGGNDLLIGGGGNDSFLGGGGDDVMDGGSGADNLNGGLGADTFMFAQADLVAGANDTVADFSVAQADKFVIAGGDEGNILLNGTGLTRQLTLGSSTISFTFADLGNVIGEVTDATTGNILGGARITFDAAGANNTSRIIEFVSLSGRLDQVTTVFDDNSFTSVDYDQDAAEAFMFVEREFEAGGALRSVTTLLDNGNAIEASYFNGVIAQESTFDFNGDEAFASMTTFFTSAGAADRTLNVNDDGSFTARDFDDAGNLYYTFFDTSFDAGGKVTNNFVQRDDGVTIATTFDSAESPVTAMWQDAANQYTWLGFTDTYGDFGNGLTIRRTGTNDDMSMFDFFI